MRKITKQIAVAFKNGVKKSMGNTKTTGDKVYLHSNLIAERIKDKEFMFTLAGWKTPTTRERLNGIMNELGIDFRFSQKNHEQMFGNRGIYAREKIFINLNNPDNFQVSFLAKD
jgi:hypothetical protein